MIKTLDILKDQKKKLYEKNPGLKKANVLTLEQTGCSFKYISAFIESCFDHDYQSESRMRFTPEFIEKNSDNLSGHLLPEHTEMIREIRGPKGPPDLYFFRHVNNISGVKAKVRFGQKQFRKWWNQACKNLNIERVDQYGGTKHSTVTALVKVLTLEQIQRGVTGHVSDTFTR